MSPNSWNPNRMSEAERESLAHGLQEDGWLVSQSLLVWGTVERGRRRDLIIDGEQRHDEAIKLGFKEGPAVVLDGLTEAEAQKLTIKLDAKRGSFDPFALSTLVRQIVEREGQQGIGIELGFTDAAIEQMLRPVLPPEDFSDVSIDASTSYRCPSCGYEWNGKGK